jgi:hypothetical protein
VGPGMTNGKKQTLKTERNGIEQTMTTVIPIGGLVLGSHWKRSVPSAGFNSVGTGIGLKVMVNCN